MAWSDDDGADQYLSDGGTGGAEEVGRVTVITDPEVWADYHSEFLVSGYHQLIDHFDAMGVPVLNACSFHHFVDFCFQRSSGHVPFV
jgi:hypothetical protein